ncbi:AAEL002830-PA, partial [Aedes aegypti]
EPLMKKLNKLRGVKSKKPKCKIPEQKDYRCRACLRFFTDKDSMNIHLRTHIDTLNVRCLHCSRSFDTLQGLMSHTIQNYILTSFACQHCDVLFKTKETLKDKSKYQTIEQPKAFQCDQCPKSYDSNPTLQKHKLLHNPKLLYECDHCGKRFWSINTIRYHVLVHRQFRDCDQCSKSYRSRQELRDHKLFAHPVRCLFCPMTFFSKKSCRSHSTKKHGMSPKPHQCELCPKSFDSARRLYCHALLHEGKFACSKCGTNFHTPTNLKKHNDRYHSNGVDEITTIVKCEPCQRTFVDASAYRSHHTRIHQHETDQNARKLDEDKPFECDHCGKRFWSINTIRYHILVHRQYRDCDQCSESFRSVKELKKHKLTTHPEKCQFCPKKYFSKKACRSHSNKAHGMIQVKLLAKNGTVTYQWRPLRQEAPGR